MIDCTLNCLYGGAECQQLTAQGKIVGVSHKCHAIVVENLATGELLRCDPIGRKAGEAFGKFSTPTVGSEQWSALPDAT